jgi:rhodanese-related sulfurtransferase
MADAEQVAEAIRAGATVVDVRDPSERTISHPAGTIHVYVPDLRHEIPGDDDVWLVCASGFRAAIAAGLVERAGRTPVTVTSGGISTLLESHPDLLAT